MSSVTSRLMLAGAFALATACGDTGRDHFTVPLYAQGTEPRDVEVEGGTLRLERASLSFGPLYLCATESAETELCETALAEWLAAGTIDGLSESPKRLGVLEATTGEVRSGFFDYGISWLLTSQAPEASEGTNGHSAVLTFQATPEGEEPFEVRVEIDVEPLGPGDAAVNALRTRNALHKGDTLTVVFDPNAWLRRVRLQELVALDDDKDLKVSLRPGDQAYEAIVQAMTANAKPTFKWGRKGVVE